MDDLTTSNPTIYFIVALIVYLSSIYVAYSLSCINGNYKMKVFLENFLPIFVIFNLVNYLFTISYLSNLILIFAIFIYISANFKKFNIKRKLSIFIVISYLLILLSQCIYTLNNLNDFEQDSVNNYYKILDYLNNSKQNDIFGLHNFYRPFFEIYDPKFYINQFNMFMFVVFLFHINIFLLRIFKIKTLILFNLLFANPFLNFFTEIRNQLVSINILLVFYLALIINIICIIQNKSNIKLQVLIILIISISFIVVSPQTFITTGFIILLSSILYLIKVKKIKLIFYIFIFVIFIICLVFLTKISNFAINQLQLITLYSNLDYSQSLLSQQISLNKILYEFFKLKINLYIKLNWFHFAGLIITIISAIVAKVKSSKSSDEIIFLAILNFFLGLSAITGIFEFTLFKGRISYFFAVNSILFFLYYFQKYYPDYIKIITFFAVIHLSIFLFSQLLIIRENKTDFYSQIQLLSQLSKNKNLISDVKHVEFITKNKKILTLNTLNIFEYKCNSILIFDMRNNIFDYINQNNLNKLNENFTLTLLEKQIKSRIKENLFLVDYALFHSFKIKIKTKDLVVMECTT